MEAVDREQPQADRRVGTILRGKYQIDRVLGSGGMAVVYSATHQNNAKQFAIKILHEQISANHDFRRRFTREGYIANKVKHRGAVAVLDDDLTDDGCAFLVMELLEGVSLDALHERAGTPGLDVRTVLAVAHDLLDALSAAHANGIVHRDVKPANVFLTRSGVKILDFGIARLYEPGAHVTIDQTVLGTPSFMPPEQAAGETEAVGAQSDIWAVGATMFFLLSGEPVHTGNSASQVMVKAASTPPRSLATTAGGLSPLVIALVDKALAFQRARRWESAAAMRAAIAEVWRDLYHEPISMAAAEAHLSSLSSHNLNPNNTFEKSSSARQAWTVARTTVRDLVGYGPDRREADLASAGSTKSARAAILSSSRARMAIMVGLMTMIAISLVASVLIVKRSRLAGAHAAEPPQSPDTAEATGGSMPAATSLPLTMATSSADPITTPATVATSSTQQASSSPSAKASTPHTKPQPPRRAAPSRAAGAPSVDLGSFR